jgi:hypothetical protein
MTTISSALSLVDTVGAAVGRQAPSIATGGESGFDAIFARALEQPEQSSTSARADLGESARVDRPAPTADDRRVDDRRAEGADRRSSASDDRAATGVERSGSTDSSDSTDEVSEPRDTAERAESADAGLVQVVQVVSVVPVQPVQPVQVAVAAPLQLSPSLVPGVVADAAVPTGAGGVGSAAMVGGAPSNVPGVASAPGVPGASHQSIAVPTETPAETVATVQAENVAVEPGAAAPTTTAPAAGDAVVDAAATAPAEPARTESGPSSSATSTDLLGAAPAAPTSGEQPTGDPNAGQGGQPQTSLQPAPMVNEVAPEAVVEAAPVVATAPMAGSAASDDAAPGGPAADARPSVAPVSASASSSAPTIAERVEAATVRTPEPEAQRGLDGTRLRDRFVGNGLGGTMTVDLSDEGLGQLSLQAHQGSGGLHVTLAAGESSTRDLLLSQSASLRSELESLGSLGSLDVTDSLPGGGNGRGAAGDGRATGTGDRSGDADRRGRSDRSSGDAGPRPVAGSTRSSTVRSAGSTGLDLLI